MTTRTVTLSDQLNTFIEDSVAAGHFANANDTVCAALELLEREQTEYPKKLAWLQQAAQQADGEIERGEGTRYESLDQLLQDIHRIGEEVRAEAASRAA